MATPTQRGIVFQKHSGQQQVHFHPETFAAYLESLPRNEKGWVSLAAVPVESKHKSHHVIPLAPERTYRNRITKEDGSHKKAG